MPLDPGTTRPYSITAKIGDGGRGEVYRAIGTSGIRSTYRVPTDSEG